MRQDRRHLGPLVEQLRGCAVLVVGDVMLDEYLRGDVSRISPEAPVPVLEVRSREHRLGGAANAAANIAALGGVVTLVGVVGRDDTANALGELLAKHSITGALVDDASRPTSRKTRLVAQQQQIVRVDDERRTPVDGATIDRVRAAIDARIADCRAVVLSDYAKGVIVEDVARHAIEAARRARVPVIVDPKQRDIRIYRGATVLTPNLAELAAASTLPVFDVRRAAQELLPKLDGAALLVTRSAEGMSLFRAAEADVHVPAIAREVFDVTGAGDTVVAAIALALGAGIAIEIAMEIATVAAAISVSKRGTATVSPAELVAALDDE